MRVLIACERSGRVRDAFRLFGHDAWSCDLVESDAWGPHIQRDALEVIGDQCWDLIIAHPPCTYLSRVNVAYRRLHPELQSAAEALAVALWHASCPRLCLENPIGSLWTAIGKPNQVIHPWWFGDPYTKATCLWLRGLPRLSSMIGPDAALSYPQAAAQRPRGDGPHTYPQKMAHSPEKGRRIRHRGVDDWWRWPTPEGVRPWLKTHFTSRLRSQTFWGVALAMAEQWGGQTIYPHVVDERPFTDR